MSLLMCKLHCMLPACRHRLYLLYCIFNLQAQQSVTPISRCFDTVGSLQNSIHDVLIARCKHYLACIKHSARSVNHNVFVYDAPERMERTASETSQAYSDVFDEDMPDQFADDEVSDVASIRSGMTLVLSRSLPGKDCQKEEAYIQGKWPHTGIGSMPTAIVNLHMRKKQLIKICLMQVQMRLSVLYPCPQVQTLLASLAACAVLASGNPARSLVCQKCEGRFNVPWLHQCFHVAA